MAQCVGLLHDDGRSYLKGRTPFDRRLLAYTSTTEIRVQSHVDVLETSDTGALAESKLFSIRKLLQTFFKINCFHSFFLESKSTSIIITTQDTEEILVALIAFHILY